MQLGQFFFMPSQRDSVHFAFAKSNDGGYNCVRYSTKGKPAILTIKDQASIPSQIQIPPKAIMLDVDLYFRNDCVARIFDGKVFSQMDKTESLSLDKVEIGGIFQFTNQIYIRVGIVEFIELVSLTKIKIEGDRQALSRDIAILSASFYYRNKLLLTYMPCF